jgi:phosphoribosyl 1,2-cyclic phosphodiesterase
MGTGSSGGTPKLTCLTKTSGEQCETCFSAQQPGDPNNRRNTSAIIHTKWFNVRKIGESFNLKSAMDDIVLTPCLRDRKTSLENVK